MDRARLTAQRVLAIVCPRNFGRKGLEATSETAQKSRASCGRWGLPSDVAPCKSCQAISITSRPVHGRRVNSLRVAAASLKTVFKVAASITLIRLHVRGVRGNFRETLYGAANPINPTIIARVRMLRIKIALIVAPGPWSVS